MDPNAALARGARAGLPFFLPRQTENTTTDNDADAQPAQQGSSAYSYFLFLAFIFFLMSGGPTNVSDPNADTKLQAIITRRSLELAKYGDWYHGNASQPLPDDEDQPSWNNTFELERFQPAGDATIIQPLFNTLFTSNKMQEKRLYWQNVTGFLQGSWAYLDSSTSLSLPEHYNTTSQVLDNRGSFPFTKTGLKEQRMYMKLTEKNASRGLEETLDHKVSLMIGSMELRSAASDMVLELEVEGVHFLENGTFLLTAAPATMSLNLKQLPAMLPSPPLHSQYNLSHPVSVTTNLTASTVMYELAHRITRMESILQEGKASTLVSSDSSSSTPEISIISEEAIQQNVHGLNCSFAIHGQIRPLPPATTPQELADYEKELENPTGRSRPLSIPASLPLVDLLLYSPECQLLLSVSSDISQSSKSAAYINGDWYWYNRATTFAALLGVTTLFQCVLLVVQMERTVTPSSLVKVSYWTVVFQGALDSYTFVAHLTLGTLVDERAAFALFIPAFFSCLSGFLFGMRWAANIRLATLPSARPTPPVAATATAQVDPALPTDPADEVETPRLSLRTRMWRNLTGDNSPIWLIAFYGGMGSIFAFFLYFGFVVSLTIILYSFWLPQIYLNAQRGTARRSLAKEYIVGNTLLRLFLPLYVWAYPGNILFKESSGWVWILVLYQFFQMTMLLLQDLLGSRFFIPAAWDIFPAQERWNYHPLVPPFDLESGSGSKSADCMICLERIQFAGESEEEEEPRDEDEKERLLDRFRRDASLATKTFSRFSYMVTPCHHIAHTRCLENWLAVKNECPICRRHLPAA